MLPCTLWVASPLPLFLETLTSALLRKGSVLLGDTVLPVLGIKVESPLEFSEKVLCETLPPRVASTG
jgi:hypothetical protein